MSLTDHPANVNLCDENLSTDIWWISSSTREDVDGLFFSWSIKESEESYPIGSYKFNFSSGSILSDCKENFSINSAIIRFPTLDVYKIVNDLVDDESYEHWDDENDQIF